MTTFSESYHELVEPLFGEPEIYVPGPWSGHIPFMFPLFRNLRPTIFVELGVFAGSSLIAAASAARKYNIGTTIYGIDTWEGDPHSGRYDSNTILGPLRERLKTFGSQIALIQGEFDTARGRFPHANIDVLHIDGLHTYEAVAHDFFTWKNALAENAVVLFHDISVRRDDFGVWKFWEELRKDYAHIEFDHSNGLGVLFVGRVDQLPEALRLLVEDPGAARFYAQLAANVATTLELRMRSVQPIPFVADSDIPTVAPSANELDELRSELKRVYASKSWQVTAPLRNARRLVGRL